MYYWDVLLGGGEGKLLILLLMMIGWKLGELCLLLLIYKKVGESYVIIVLKGGVFVYFVWFFNFEV